MCGRYYIDTSHRVMKRILNEAAKENGPVQLTFGEIYPSDEVPVYVPNSKTPIFCKWGLKKFDGKGLLINARAETVTERPMFRKSFEERRCIIPANGFYEWDSKKSKYYFSRPDHELIYLCGFMREDKGEKRFIILTKSATPPVSSYHSRIPVMTTKDQKNDYLNDTKYASSFVTKDSSIELNCS